MRSLLLCVFSFLVCTAGAQTDTLQKLPDTIRSNSGPDPQSWYNSELPKDVAPFKDSVLLRADEVPHKLQKALDANDEFDGWRTGDLYFDRVNKFYKLFIRRGTNVDRFILTKGGKIISIQSYRGR